MAFRPPQIQDYCSSQQHIHVIIPINTRHYGSSSPDNAVPHANVLNSEPLSCDPAVEVGGVGDRQRRSHNAREGALPKQHRKKL